MSERITWCHGDMTCDCGYAEPHQDVIDLEGERNRANEALAAAQERIAEDKQEIDRLEGLLQATREDCVMALDARATDMLRAQAEAQRLRAALREYGYHSTRCASEQEPHGLDQKCDCGLAEAQRHA